MISDDIKMECGLDRCAKATFKRWKKVSSEESQLNSDNIIQDLHPVATYIYLGMDDGDGTDH